MAGYVEQGFDASGGPLKYESQLDRALSGAQVDERNLSGDMSQRKRAHGNGRHTVPALHGAATKPTAGPRPTLVCTDTGMCSTASE